LQYLEESPYDKTVSTIVNLVESKILESILELAKEATAAGQNRIRIIVLNKDNREKLYQVIDKINENKIESTAELGIQCIGKPKV